MPKSVGEIVDQLDGDEAIRLFEIANRARAEEAELFWKRANYFWLFVAADLTTYGLLWRTGGSGPDAWQYRILIAVLGLIGTVCWILANMGSRWVFHKWLAVSKLLEERMTRVPLYREAAENGATITNEVAAWQRFSSTRVAIFFGVVMSAAWCGLIVMEMVDISAIATDKIQFGGAALVVALVTCLLAYEVAVRRRM